MSILGLSTTEYHTVDLKTERKLGVKTWTSAVMELSDDEQLVVVFGYTGRKASLRGATQRKVYAKNTALELAVMPSVKDYKVIEFCAVKPQAIMETSEEVRRLTADLVGQAQSVQMNNIQDSLRRRSRR